MSDPRDDLKRLAPWLSAFVAAADEYQVRRSVLAAMCLRESLGSWAGAYTRKGSHLGWGDHGRAFGLWQVDRRYHEAALRGLVPGHQLLTPLGQARYAAAIIAGARAFLAAWHPASPRLEQAAVAAHNADLSRVDLQLESGSDPDAVTTGFDYGADVLRRAAALEARDPTTFPPSGG